MTTNQNPTCDRCGKPVQFDEPTDADYRAFYHVATGAVSCRKPYTLEDWIDANDRAMALQDLYRKADELRLEDWAERIGLEADEAERHAETIQLDLIARGIEP